MLKKMFLTGLVWMILVYPTMTRAESPEISTIADSIRVEFESLHGVERVEKMIGQARKFIRSDPAISQQILLETIKYSAEINYGLGVARANNGMGVVLQLTGKYTDGLNYFKSALSEFEELENLEGQASALQNLAGVQLSLDLLDESLATCERALVLRQELGSEIDVAKSMRSLGLVHRELGNHEKALDYSRQYLVFVEKTGDKAGTAKVLSAIGTIQSELGRQQEGRASCEESVSRFRTIDDQYGLGVALVNLGEVCLNVEDWAGAIAACDEGLAMGEQMKIKDLMKMSHHVLARAHEEKEHPQKALRHYHKYRALKSELFNEKTSLRIAELTARFEVAQDRNRLLKLERDQVAVELELEVGRRQRDIFLVGFAISLPMAILAFFLFRRASSSGQKLAIKADELEVALGNLRTLKGLVPICANCKNVRDDEGYWHQVEAYVTKHSHAEFSHGICPPCAELLYGDLLKEEEPDQP